MQFVINTSIGDEDKHTITAAEWSVSLKRLPLMTGLKHSVTDLAALMSGCLIYVTDLPRRHRLS